MAYRSDRPPPPPPRVWERPMVGEEPSVGECKRDQDEGEEGLQIGGEEGSVPW